ncbi:hypothetical protein Q9233_002596, partial [Columba guinea]
PELCTLPYKLELGRWQHMLLLRQGSKVMGTESSVLFRTKLYSSSDKRGREAGMDWLLTLIGLTAVCPYSQSTAIAGKKCDRLEMEDEEGYTALNLRPTASVITPGYLSSKKCSAFKAPAICVTVDRASATSPIWQPVAFAFLALCLVLLIGLVALLALFFQISKDPEEGKKLQEMREALCFERKEENGLCYMTTSSVPPYTDILFMPATPVQQSNYGSVRKGLFISPEEALQEGMWDLPL